MVKYKFLYFFIIFPMFLFISSITIDDVPSKCDEENSRKKDDDPTKCLQCDSKNLTLCISCRSIYIPIGNYTKCVEACSDNQYGIEVEYDGENYLECRKCNDACADGCNGPEPNLSDNGCKKCKYGIVKNKLEKSCLSIQDKNSENPCYASGYTYFYPKKAVGEDSHWANFICDFCSDNCVSCNSEGNSPKDNGCVCQNYLVNYGKSSECLDKCPVEDGFRIINSSRNNLPYRICAYCPSGEEDAEKQCCVENGECLTLESISWWIIIIYVLIFIFVVLVIFVLTCYLISKHNRNICCNFRNYDPVEIQENKSRQRKEHEKKPMSLKDHRMQSKRSQNDCINECSSEKSSITDLEMPSTSRYQFPIKQHKTLVNEQLTTTNEILTKENLFDKTQQALHKEKLEPLTKEARQILLRNQPWDPNKIIVSEDEVELGEELGRGAFGIVYKAIFHGREVAVKVIENDKASKKALNQEAKIMTTCKHNNIQSLLAFCPGQKLLLISDLRPCGSLDHYLKENKDKLEDRYLYLYCAQIASGMDYLVKNKVVHSDLAARNILIENKEHVLVSDFGLSKVLGNETSTCIYGKVAFKWLSIECLESAGKNATHENDVWAFGVTCWEIFDFCQHSPYYDLAIGTNYLALLSILKTGRRLEMPLRCDVKVFWQISECWKVDPMLRPNFSTLHTFFNKIFSTIQDIDIYGGEDTEDSNCRQIFEDTTDDESEDIVMPLDRTVAFHKQPSTSYTSYVELDAHKQPLSISSNSGLSSAYSTNFSKIDDVRKVHNQVNELKIKDLEELTKVNINKIKFGEKTYLFENEDIEISSKEIYFSDLEHKKTISQESSAKETTLVLKCLHKPSSTIMAVKSINMSKDLTETILQCNAKNFVNEISKLQELSKCENIVTFYGFCFDQNYARICMEYMDFSLKDLHKIFLNKKKFLSEDFLGCINTSVLNALMQCHEKKIVHSNLLLENVLVNRKGEIKLGDWKMSHKSEEDDDKYADIFALGYLLHILTKKKTSNAARPPKYSDELLFYIDLTAVIQSFRSVELCQEEYKSAENLDPYNTLTDSPFYQRYSKDSSAIIVQRVINEAEAISSTGTSTQQMNS